MKEEIFNEDYHLKNLKSNKNLKENEINKNNDISTTKEEDSFIIDDLIQYCSSPKQGLVSINISNNSNNEIMPIPTEKNRIANTITMTIAMIRKEIDLKDFDRLKIRSSSFRGGGDGVITFKNKMKGFCQSNKYISENIKENKCKSIFKEKKIENAVLEKTKTNIIGGCSKTNTKSDTFTINVNKTPIKNKTSKTKKKKKNNKKNNEKGDEQKIKQKDKEKDKDKDKDREKRRLSLGEENKKKKKNKKKNKKCTSQKKIKAEINEKNKNNEKENERQNSNIIILDFSSSEGMGEATDSDKNNNSEKFDNTLEEKKKEKKNEEEKVNQKDEPDDFFNQRQKTILLSKKKKEKETVPERKFVMPKAKQSCHLRNPYKINQATKASVRSDKRKMTTNYIPLVNKDRIKHKSKSNIPLTDKKPGTKELYKDKNKEKRRKDSHNLFKIASASKSIFIKNEVDKQPIKIRHSITKNILMNQSQEKIKFRISDKESVQSCKALNKQYKHLTVHNNNDKNPKMKEIQDFDKRENKKEQADYRIKSNKNLAIKTFNKTPKSKTSKKNSYNSNRNLTKITINPTTAENKDIHLVYGGKQETIINYTNQEMVDDENEYMVECLKVLLKLNRDEQPSCKQKVNFNFPENGKKKIALFDLDETLVHCTKGQKGLNGDTVNIKLPTNKVVPVGLNIRPHWKEALDIIKNHYHIVVYTASHQSYADAVLNYLDKDNKYFQYRLYRNHCVQCDVDGIKFYVKDLDTLNKYYNLKDVVLIDNSVLSFAYHLNNGIPIVPFIEQKDDTQLIMLAYYLVSIASFDDLTIENKKHINIEHFLLRAKTLAEEEVEEEEEEEEEEKNSNLKIVEQISNEDSSKVINKEKINENKEKNIEETEGNKDDKNNDKSRDIEQERKNYSHTDIINSEKSEFKIKIENKYNRFLTLRKSNKLLTKKSEKALKIVQDMKKNINDIYRHTSDK